MQPCATYYGVEQLMDNEDLEEMSANELLIEAKITLAEIAEFKQLLLAQMSSPTTLH